MWPFVIFFVLAGIGLLFAAHKLKLAAKKSQSWPTVPGKLERCEVVERGMPASVDPSTWHLDLVYSYTVRGVTYKGSTYAFGYSSLQDDAPHRTVAAALKSQSDVTVYYDPRHPSESVLNTAEQPNLNKLGNSLLVVALVCFLFALAGF